MGLAGFFLVTDAWERFLVKHGILPKPDYNNPADSRDIPLVLADRCFCKPEGGSKVARIHFDPFDHDGYLGSIPVCNGMAFPKLEVKARKYRLRLLNGALARVHLLELWDAGEIAEGANLDELFSDAGKDGHPYRIEKAWHRIGKDSWMTERPVKDSSILLAMADRADVIVDFKVLLKGRKKATFFLVNVCDQRNGRGPGHGDNGLADADGAGTTNRPRGDRENVPRLDDVDRQVEFSVNEGGPTWGTLKVLRIDVTAVAGADPCSFTGDLSTLKTLLARPDIQAEIAADPQLAEQAGLHLRKHDNLMETLTWEQIRKLPQRRFDFERGKGAWRVSHRFFDERRADAPVVLGSLEVWRLVNRSGGWWHPIHIHLESHQQIVVEFDGTKRSRKDRSGAHYSDKHTKDLLPHDRYKHDTAILGPNTEILLLMRFRTFLGPFVFHCHNLNHEDMLMMSTFDPRLESLGDHPKEEHPPQRVPMAGPMIPEKLMHEQIDGKFHPLPSGMKTSVQQMFGDECH